MSFVGRAGHLPACWQGARVPVALLEPGYLLQKEGAVFAPAVSRTVSLNLLPG
jgi:hypothetical protein